MVEEINVMIFYVSTAVFVGLISVLAYYLHTHKKREGMSYPLAIQRINQYIQKHYGSADEERFCEEFEIPANEGFLDALHSSGEDILVPQQIAEVLNKIGYRVKLVNKVFYQRID